MVGALGAQISRVERNKYEFSEFKKDYLREECSKEREQQAQRPRGMGKVGGSEGSLVVGQL